MAGETISISVGVAKQIADWLEDYHREWKEIDGGRFSHACELVIFDLRRCIAAAEERASADSSDTEEEYPPTLAEYIAWVSRADFESSDTDAPHLPSTESELTEYRGEVGPRLIVSQGPFSTNSVWGSVGHSTFDAECRDAIDWQEIGGHKEYDVE